jgi:hypothetical protein
VCECQITSLSSSEAGRYPTGGLGGKPRRLLLKSTPGQILVAGFGQQPDVYILVELAGLGEIHVETLWATLAGLQVTRLSSHTVAQGVAHGGLSEARPRLTPSSGLERHCSPSRTKPDLVKGKISATNLGTCELRLPHLPVRP